MRSEEPQPVRDRILQAAAALMAEGGADAASTRAICAAAGVQAPTLYRLFGDKRGLLDALVDHEFQAYMAGKRTATDSDDPVDRLRRGWDLHVGFGMTHPAVYVLTYGDVRAGSRSPAAESSYDHLRAVVEGIARAGRLRVPVEAAAQMVRAAGVGVTLELISSPGGDLALSRRMREVVIGAITTGPAPGDGDGSLAPHMMALVAALATPPDTLTTAESAMLREWLQRLVADGA